MIAHEAGNPLTAARAGLQLTLETLRSPGDLTAVRGEVLEDLGQVLDDIDRAVAFLRAVQDRARASPVERFDLVRYPGRAHARARRCRTAASPAPRDVGRVGVPPATLTRCSSWW
jgi:hypothetical protein